MTSKPSNPAMAGIRGALPIASTGSMRCTMARPGSGGSPSAETVKTSTWWPRSAWPVAKLNRGLPGQYLTGAGDIRLPDGRVVHRECLEDDLGPGLGHVDNG